MPNTTRTIIIPLQKEPEKRMAASAWDTEQIFIDASSRLYRLIPIVDPDAQIFTRHVVANGSVETIAAAHGLEAK